MKHLFSTITTVVLAAGVLCAGIVSYNGLNGKGYHDLIEQGQKGNVYFWYTNDLMTNYYNNVASVYNQEHRGANVVPKLVSAGEYLERIYQSSVEGADYPDVYVITSDVMEKAYLSGITLPVEDEAEVRAVFPDVAVQAASYDGTLLGYPLYFDTSTLVYNKTLLEEIAMEQFRIQAMAEGMENTEELEVSEEQIADLVGIMIPETIDELITFSNNLEAPDGMETVFKWNINDVFFNYFYLGAYAVLTDKEIDIYNEDTAACMEVFKHVTEYFYMDADTVSTESILQEFMDGKVLFTILDSESALKLEVADAEGELGFVYDYALLPDPSSELQGRPMSVTNVVVVNGYTKYADTANDFARFLTMQPEGTEQMYEKTGYIPANSQTAITTNMEKVFKQEYEKSVTIPNSIVTSNFWMLLETAFNEIWDGADAQATLENIENRLKDQIP